MTCTLQLFGWDLDSLWQTVHQRRCDAFLRADQVIKAVESYQSMMRMIDEAEKTSCLGWSNSGYLMILDNSSIGIDPEVD
jgi:hypothetical protein